MWFDELLSREPARREGNNLLYDATGSADWTQRQQDSVERYASEHYEEDARVARMFGNFIATGLQSRDAVVVDVGAGISSALPHYVDELGLDHYLAVEPLNVPVERQYPCLVGAVAEQLPLKDATADAVVFATSLDHMEDEGAAIDEARRVLKPDGSIFVWHSIHDPDTVATSSTLHRLKRGAIGIPLVALQGAVMFQRMRKRQRQLARGARLDPAHFRWYTRDGLRDAVRRWGMDLVRELEPPSVPVMYIEAR